VKSQLFMSSWSALREEANLPSSRAVSALRRLAKSPVARRERLHEGNLHRMSDHMLKDIGLDSSEVFYGTSKRPRVRKRGR
jgi:uncharacterized protein YjiS (DUF1127 family)